MFEMLLETCCLRMTARVTNWSVVTPALKRHPYISHVKFINERGAPMRESTALAPIEIEIPDEIWDLLGDPPVLTEEESLAFQKILERFVQAVHPRDIIEWFHILDLTVQRTAILRFQRLKTRLIQQAHNNLVQARADCLRSAVPVAVQKLREATATELAAKIKALQGEPGAIKAETDKLEAESKANYKALFDKLGAEAIKKTQDNETAVSVEETAPGLFGKWIEPFERADRALIAEQKKFKESLRDLEDHRRGLGELLRQAEADIIDGECEEDVTPKEDRPLVHALEVPVPPQIIDQADPPLITVCGIGRLPAKLGAK
jgi:hypothetical protein